jgi:hypothetical protein
MVIPVAIVIGIAGNAANEFLMPYTEHAASIVLGAIFGPLIIWGWISYLRN